MWQLFTGQDNATLDLGRVAWAGSFLAVIALATFHCIKGTAPTLMELAGALGAIAGTHGAALFFKRDTEPRKDGQ